MSQRGLRYIDYSLTKLIRSFNAFRLRQNEVALPLCRHYTSTADSTALKRAIGRGNLKNVEFLYDNMYKTRQKIDRSTVRKILLLARKGKRQQDLNFVKQIIDDMKGPLNINPQHFEYHALIFAYGMQHAPEKAHEVLDRMKKDGVQPNLYTYNTLLGCYKRTNDLQSADKLVQEMKQNNISPDTVTYNTILHLLSRKGEFDRLFKLFDVMISDKDNVYPDMFTYSTVLEAAVKSGNQDQGNKICGILFNLSNSKDIDQNMMNVILRFQASLGLTKALDLYYQLGETYLHIKPDRTTYNILLDACLKNNNPAKAYMIYKDMKKAKVTPDIITYGTLINAEAKSGTLKNAIQLFEDMCNDSIEPDDRIMTSLVNIASSKSSTLEDLEKLMALTRRHSHSLKLDTKAYNALMYGLSLHGQSEQVQKLYDTVFRDINCQPDVATFTNLILAYINDDLIDDALEIYFTLREHHRKCRDHLSTQKIPIKLDTTFYSTLISSLSNGPTSESFQVNDDENNSSPRLVAAMTMFNDMRPLQIQPTIHTYTSMLHACGQYRDRYVLDKIHQQIKVDLYLDPDIGIYNSLMDAYNRTEDGEAVLDIWQTISMPASYSNITPDQTSVSIVLDSCGHNGLVSRARTIWKWLKRTQFILNTNNYNSYIECLCREDGRTGWDEAIEIVKEEMSTPDRPLHGSPIVDMKTVNTLISFAKKKNFKASEIDSLEKWKFKLFK